MDRPCAPKTVRRRKVPGCNICTIRRRLPLFKQVALAPLGSSAVACEDARQTRDFAPRKECEVSTRRAQIPRSPKEDSSG
jgi:hypothetical protein